MTPKRTAVPTDADYLYRLFRFGYVDYCPHLEELILYPCDLIQPDSDTGCRWARYANAPKARYVEAVREAKHPSLFALQKALVLYADSMCVENIDRFVYGLAVEDLTGPG